MIKLKCKCKGCNSREVGCHSSCDDYKEYRKAIDKIREIERVEKLVSCYKGDSKERIYSTYRIKKKFKNIK